MKYSNIKVFHFNSMIVATAKHYGFDGNNFRDFSVLYCRGKDEKTLKEIVAKVPYQTMKSSCNIGKKGLKAIVFWLEIDGLKMPGTPIP